MKHIALYRALLVALISCGLILSAAHSDARKHPRPTPTPQPTPTPTPRPSPPPTISAAGNWTSCAEVTDNQQLGPSSLQTLSVTKTFTGTLNGSFTGKEYDYVKSDGSAVFYGDGTFTGTVNGKTGTFKMNYIGRIGSDDSYDAHWVIRDGTGDLAQLLGEGSFTGNGGMAGPGCDNPFDGTYEGRLVFANIPHR